jgi:hypothetical protein
MKALIAYESMFGNTARVAREIAAGLAESIDSTCLELAEVPAPTASQYDVVVLGGPTHAFTMSTPNSRQEARRRGGRGDRLETGIREWLEAFFASADGGPASRPRVLFATFDTRVTTVRHFPGSAARAAARRLRHHGAVRVAEPHSFFVLDQDGPLAPGEELAAREWGRLLAEQATQPVRQ